MSNNRESMILGVDGDTSGVEEAFARFGNKMKGFAQQAAGSLQSFQAAISNIGAPVQQVMGYLEQAGQLAEFAAERARQRAFVDQASLSSLTAATRGLVTESTLLAVASRANQGQFALTAQQLAIVGDAATALQGRFGSVEEVLSRVSDMLRKGSFEGLKDYGISIDTTKTKAEQFEQALQQLAGVNEKLTESQRKQIAAFEDTQRTLVKTKDGIEKTKEVAGIAADIEFAKLSKASGFVKDTLHMLRLETDDVVDETKLLSTVYGDAIKAHNDRTTAVEDETHAMTELARQQQETNEMMGPNAYPLAPDQRLVNMTKQAEENEKKAKERHKARKERSASTSDAVAEERAAFQALLSDVTTGRDTVLSLFREQQVGLADIATGVGDFWQATTDALGAQAGAESESTILGWIDATKEAAGDLVGNFDAAAEAGQRLLGLKPSKGTGPLDQWGQMKKGVADYGTVLRDVGRNAFGQFTEAAGASFAALITGQDDAAKGFAERVGDMLRSAAVELQVLAFKALGLAAMEPLAAGTYLTAAAMFEAGSIAAGVASRAFPSGGGGESSAPPSSSTGGRNFEGSGNTGQSGAQEIHFHLYKNYTTSKEVMRDVGKILREGQMTGQISGRTPAAKRLS